MKTKVKVGPTRSLSQVTVTGTPEAPTSELQGTSASPAAQLVSLCFELRDLAHVAHLQVSGPGSYARHMALSEFYEGIVGIADSFAESYQGRYGILQVYPTKDITLTHAGNDISGMIQAFRSWVDQNRKECGSDSELQNEIDNIQTLNNRTLYKLLNLQ